MAMDASRLESAIKVQILAEFAAHGWDTVGGPPSGGTEKDNPNTAPSKVLLDLAESIATAVADQVVLEITTYAQATGTDSRGDTHALAII